MKIVVTGGGSGGHITPILAVARELKQRDPKITIIYIGQKGDALSDVPIGDPHIDTVYTVWAGKLRRYSNEGWKQLLDVRTQALNLRDIFRLLRGIVQSYFLLRSLKPDAIFTRGGFVSVPVAIGGRLNHIPYMTHDSDSTPSLANRLIAKHAALHAVALPAELYPYPAAKTVMVGVPIGADYVPVTTALQTKYRDTLGFENYAQVLFVTGGGNGARVLNEVVAANCRYLLAAFPKLVIVHVAGRGLEAATAALYDGLGLGLNRLRVQVHGFVHDLYRYSGAADVVIARGGATNLAEFAAQGVACLIVPSAQLGWNVKNAQTLAAQGAIVQLSEDQAEQPERLGRCVQALLNDPTERQRLQKAIRTYAKPHAAKEIVDVLIPLANKGA